MKKEKSLEELNTEITNCDKKIAYYNDQIKILGRRLSKETIRERTHKLSRENQIKQAQSRMKVIANTKSAWSDYKQFKDIHTQYSKIGWKRRKEKFQSEHKDELVAYDKAYRFLMKNLPDMTYSEKKLSSEYADLEQEVEKITAELAPVKEDLKQAKFF